MIADEVKTIIDVDHSVALEVKEGDYYGINVKYAKKAGEVEKLPELKAIAADDDTVSFEIGEENYKKRIDNVKYANTAKYDTKGRLLENMANSEDYAALVQNWLDGHQLVQSLNGETGNVVITKNKLGLGNVENTKDLDKPISTATQEALDQKQDKIVAGSNIRIDDGNVINALVDFHPVTNMIRDLEGRVSFLVDAFDGRFGRIEDNVSQNADDITTLSNRAATDESNISANTSEIATLKTKVTSLESSVADLDLAPYAKTSEVDSKIAEQAAAEEVHNRQLQSQITENATAIANEVTAREASESRITTDYQRAITEAVGQIRVALDNYYTKTEVDSLLSTLENALPDMTDYFTKAEVESNYVSKADFNTAIASLQQQINNNIGRVLTSDPGESNRLWVEN